MANLHQRFISETDRYAHMGLCVGVRGSDIWGGGGGCGCAHGARHAPASKAHCLVRRRTDLSAYAPPAIGSVLLLAERTTMKTDA